MSRAEQTKQTEQADCEPYPEGEETPDGLRGTPGERFTEAMRRAFTLPAERVAEIKAQSGAVPKHRHASPRVKQA